MGLFSCQAGMEVPHRGSASSGHRATAGSNATVLQGDKRFLPTSPTFTKEKVPQQAATLETPIGCCGATAGHDTSFLVKSEV